MATKKAVTKKKAAKKKNRGKNGLKEEEQVEIFCQAIMEGKTQAAAFISSHPDAKNWKPESIYPQASKYAATNKVRTRLAELKQAHRERHMATIDRVLEELSRIAFFNPKDLFDGNGKPIPLHELPDDVAAVITGYQINTRGKGSHLDSLKTISKDKGLELLGKWFKMWSDNAVPAGGQGASMNFTLDASKMTPEEAAAYYKKFKNIN